MGQIKHGKSRKEQGLGTPRSALPSLPLVLRGSGPWLSRRLRAGQLLPSVGAFLCSMTGVHTA